MTPRDDALSVLTGEWRATTELAGAPTGTARYHHVIRGLRILRAEGVAERRESWRRGGPRHWVRVAEWRLAP